MTGAYDHQVPPPEDYLHLSGKSAPVGNFVAMTTTREINGTNGTSETNGTEETFCPDVFCFWEGSPCPLKKAKVAVCGLGRRGFRRLRGFGRSGVGFLRIIDFDRIA